MENVASVLEDLRWSLKMGSRVVRNAKFNLKIAFLDKNYVFIDKYKIKST